MKNRLPWIASDDELVLAVILFKDEPTGSMSSVKAHMRAPIIFNVSKRRGLQKILQEFDAHSAIRGA